MSEWCLQHPYLFFFLAISVIVNTTSIVVKVLEAFKKTAPTTINMSVDPNKLVSYGQSDVDNSGIVH